MSVLQPSHYSVLHITPHLGGGVGTVLLNYLKHSTATDTFLNHSILSLDFINENAKESLINLGVCFEESVFNNIDLIDFAIAEADIVLVHWWNHPLLTYLLVNHTLPPCRLIFWAHISGVSAPNNFTYKVLTYPDIFAFTTPASYSLKEFQDLSLYEQSKVIDIWSTAGVERLSGIVPKCHEGFHVGYLGSLDPSKIHPDFITICKSIDIPDIRFTVIGAENNVVINEARNHNLLEKITFTGQLPFDKVLDLIRTFDVFGYPLSRDHFGTCDQTLQECMALGIPPVVLNNAMESLMVMHNITGLVSTDEASYINHIKELYFDSGKRKILGLNAKDFATKTFLLSNCVLDWKKTFDRVMSLKKSLKVWKGGGLNNMTASETYLEALGDYSTPFRNYMDSYGIEREKYSLDIKHLSRSHNWTSDSKSTVHQFLHFFPNDSILKQWSELMLPNTRITNLSVDFPTKTLDST